MKKAIHPTVSIIRVLSMLVITVGHIMGFLGINDYQLTAIGVEVFFFISGYLYGKKVIEDRYAWLIQRVRRVLLPFWILAFVLSVYVMIDRDVLRGLVQFAEALMNLQGIPHVVTLDTSVGAQHIAGLKHCWFLTPMFICYILTAQINGTDLEKRVDRRPWFFLAGAVFLQIVAAFVGLQLSYYLQYFIGYFYARKEPRIRKQYGKSWCELTILTVAICVLRLVANKMIDGTMLYDAVIARLSFNVIAVWLFMTLDMVCRKMAKSAKQLVKSDLWKKTDALTFYIFLTHFMFMTDPFSVTRYIPGVLLQLMCILVFTGISAWLLKWITEWVDKMLFERKTQTKDAKEMR